MSYENANKISLDFALPGTASQTFRLPKGKKGRVRAVEVLATGAAFTGAPLIQLGVTGTLGKYVNFPTGPIALNKSTDASLVKNAIVPVNNFTSSGVELPADTDVIFTFTAGSAGTGVATVVLDYY